MSRVQRLSSESQLKNLTNKLAVLNFWASWAEQCTQMNVVFEELAKKYDNVYDFIMVEAESFPDVSVEYEIDSVPTFIILSLDGKVVERITGANAPALTAALEKHSRISATASKPLNQSAPGGPTPKTKEQLHQHLKKLTTAHPVMLFMKGTPTEPRCGFSRTTIELLNSLNADYTTFNILADEEVRQGLKEYSNWPTYPQLYVNGELVGGLDIMKEMHANGELEELLPKKTSLNDRLEKLIKSSDVMLFMKGSPDTPKCGFSRQIVGLLQSQGVTFKTFDILEDEEVRQGLKVYSDWPTYPQLYVKGELVGGLDIVREMIESGEFKEFVQGI